MAGRRRLSYQWRLFFPLVGILWVLMAALVFFQLRRERQSRADIIRSQLSMINDRVITSYKNDRDVTPFLRFITNYFNNELYDDIRLSVYDLPTGRLTYYIGQPLPLIEDPDNDPTTVVTSGDLADEYLRNEPTGEELFFYSLKDSPDGRVRSITAMPYNVSVANALATDADMWVIFIILVVIATAVAYLSTRYVSRTIRLLRDFTNHAAHDTGFIPTTKFPNDELGEISQQIINIYNKRSQALKDLEYEHKVAMKATREKSRIKRSLTNNINHELKPPIGIIKGYIDTIVENPDMPAEQRTSFLHKAQANVDRLCAMLNDISTITRLEDGKDNIPVETVDFHELVYTTADEIKETGMAPGMKFVYDLPIDCDVRGNAPLLSGMIMNLAKNAIAYSQGTEMGIKLVSENDKFYTFTFYDNGVGVEEKHLPYLFERFFRVDSGRSRKVGGTGLGLPIVKNTVVTLGGSITVNNCPEGGLQFMFTLPKA